MSHLNDITGLFPGQLQASFEDNELAFLSLTTKVEQPLRDKIAWLLNKNIGGEKNGDRLIIREWKRHDLVIMNKSNQELESIIEFKMQLGFKIANDEYKKGLCRDLYKSAVSIRDKPEGNEEKSEILFVMFGRTLKNTPILNNNVLQAMPYIRGAKIDCDALPTQPIIYPEQFENFKDDWEYWLDQACIPKNKRHWLDPVDGGSFLNLGAQIITSVVGPFSAKEVIDLNKNCWEYLLHPKGPSKGLLITPAKHIKREKYMKRRKSVRNNVISTKGNERIVEEEEIPQKVIDLAKTANRKKGRNYSDEGPLDRHYRVKMDNGDHLIILRQDGNPNLYESVEHIVDKTKAKGVTKAGTLKVWMKRGIDGKWRVEGK